MHSAYVHINNTNPMLPLGSPERRREYTGITLHGKKIYLATVGEVYVAEARDGEVGELRKVIDDLPRDQGKRD